MASMAEALPPIALIDVREGGPVRHAREHARGAQALRDDCLAWFPAVAGPFVPMMDRLARRWLRRSRSPYVAEIEAIAATLGFPGVWLLNGSYEWGCTALAREEAELPWLARTLDWPFPGLGRHAEVARMRGPAGEFFSVTWPGIRHIPPDQLLRVVFEECTTFAQARRRLEGTPIARPVIFTLAGCRPGERCVIERTEQGFVTR